MAACGRVIRFALVPHPDAPPVSIEAVEVEIVMSDPDDVLLRFIVKGADLLLPEWSSPGRVADLWQTTCFELFLRPADTAAYFEFNFSPSTRWAAYAFDGYREGMRDLELGVEPHVDRHPDFAPENADAHYMLEADVDLSGIPAGALRVGLSAVIEETDGTKSYWALAHPAAEPDFHHPGSFAFELPPANPSPRTLRPGSGQA
jgi:hypothetical protein